MPASRAPVETPGAEALLRWYDRAARALPWRVGPAERRAGVRPDPYRVWLSEIMLQQTTVAAAGPYFARFTTLWPDVAALAAAPREAVLAEWAGLGYYARARNLHACAQTVAALGEFPEDEEGLRALPGIGPYTAAAVAAIAFDKPAAVVDGNVERVFARLFAVETPLPDAKPAIRARVAALVPNARPGDFAQATMDLGATLCAPRRPLCGACPWAAACVARARGIAETLPRKAPKAAKPHRCGVAFVALRADGATLVETRPDSGLLGGMSGPVCTDWTAAPPDAAAVAAAAPFSADWIEAGAEARHVFTHFTLSLRVMVARAPLHAAPARGAFRPFDAARRAAPTALRKALDIGAAALRNGV
ncbi:A/G-specific adenine glycosylase [Rubrimonas sp.]|uniref:A/G-specific adenine glycosylase n=1 Tax=Rubrimonas sp. TaxID=2036015 RepID=UPI002FDCA39C